MIRRSHFIALALAGAAALPAAAQQATELAGVRYPASVSLGGSNLQLNGAGIRYRFVVKVYTAGLYLQGKAATPEQALAAPGPKRIQVHMLREIDANDLGRLLTRGMQDNAPRGEFSKFIPGMLKLAELFSARKRLRAGEHFSVDYVPGSGTRVLVNGKPESELITEPEFFNALLRIWLGDKPADDGLKEALLGKAPPPAATGQN
jgi:Chalcone isomerase-like